MRAHWEQRRIEVHQLLQECGNEKLLRGAFDRAVEKGKLALKLAMQPPVLPSPWPEVAHYRVAHLLLRGRDRTERLAQISEHLRLGASDHATAAGHVLGPLPHIYRMAVLHLMARHAQDDPARLRQEIDRAYQCAQDAMRFTLRPPDTTAEPCLRGPLQNEAFNLLELAVYLLELPYDPLTGLGRRELDAEFPGSGWVLVGPSPQISRVEMSETFAWAELESRGAQCQDALLLKLPAEGEAQWRTPGGRWKVANGDWIRLLANRLRYPNLSDRELSCRVTGDATAAERFRQLKRRLLVELRRITGREDLSPFDGEGVTGMPIYGAVAVKAFGGR